VRERVRAYRVKTTGDDLLEASQPSTQRSEVGEFIEQYLKASNGPLVAGFQGANAPAHHHCRELAFASVELESQALRSGLDSGCEFELTG